MLPRKTYDHTVNGRFVNRPYETTKVSDSIYDGGSKPPPYGVIVKSNRINSLPPRGRGTALAVEGA